MQKSVFYQLPFETKTILESHDQRGYVIFEYTQPKIFEPALNFHDLEQHPKKAISSFCSRDLVNLKILQSGWPTTFWLISQKPNFSQIWNVYSNIVNNINFILL